MDIRSTLLHPNVDLKDETNVHCSLLRTVEACPIADRFAGTVFGLLLRPFHGSLKTYRRLGTFKLTNDRCL